MMTEKVNGGIKIYSLLTGILYIVFGVLQTLHGFGLDIGIGDALLLAEDGIGGLVLIVIGLVFLFGFGRSSKNPAEGISFTFVGTVLGLFFGVIYILILLADLFEAKVLVSEDWEEWVLLDSIRPGLYLGIITLLGYLVFRSDLSMKKTGA
jgi:hypothetical protein